MNETAESTPVDAIVNIAGRDMRPVSRDEFFALLKADSRDIMPSIVGGNGRDGYLSEWRDQKNARGLFGASQGSPTKYFVV